MYRVRINIYISTSKLKKKKQNSTTDASINFSRTTPPPQKKIPQKRKNLKNWQQNLKFFSNQGLILFPLILIIEWTLKTPFKGDDNLKIISFFKNIQKHPKYVILISCQVKCILSLNQNQKHRKKLQITQEKFRVLPNFFFIEILASSLLQLEH